MRILRGELVALKAFIRPFIVAKYLKNNPSPKLHLGCGTRMPEGWLNADKFKSTADIYFNAKKCLPFKDNTFDIVYSEHMLEHIRTDAIPMLLSEILRVLKPGGLFRVTVPNLEILVDRYYHKDKEYFRPQMEKNEIKHEALKDKTINRNKFWLMRTMGGVFNSRVIRRIYHHHFCYDYETLGGALREIGFAQTTQQAYQKSIAPEAAAMDFHEREYETLYIDAEKATE